MFKDENNEMIADRGEWKKATCFVDSSQVEYKQEGEVVNQRILHGIFRISIFVVSFRHYLEPSEKCKKRKRNSN